MSLLPVCMLMMKQVLWGLRSKELFLKVLSESKCCSQHFQRLSVLCKVAINQSNDVLLEQNWGSLKHKYYSNMQAHDFTANISYFGGPEKETIHNITQQQSQRRSMTLLNLVWRVRARTGPLLISMNSHLLLSCQSRGPEDHSLKKLEQPVIDALTHGMNLN